MSFNSFEYLFFLIGVFLLYWLLNKNLKAQNVFVLSASYFFYGWYDYRFLILLISCSLADYFLSFQIYKSKRFKLFFLSISMSINLGILFFFKYFNFFMVSLYNGLNSLGIHNSLQTHDIVLPLGISFFTFQTLSYSIDIYRGKMKPYNNVIAFLNFTSFFPQILAGPIERGSKMIPQFLGEREFSYALATDGVRQIIYGLFKKMVVADRLAVRVDYIFDNYTSLSGFELLLGSMLFYVQIYADFSGYSDIAIGTGKLLGFNLSTNFRTPLFAKTAPEAWSRWHITLTKWFRDYVYFPLVSKNKESIIWRIACTILMLMLIGLWHGASATFLVFGLLHGTYFIPSIISKNWPGLKRLLTILKTNSFYSALSICTVFTIASATTVFFRSPDISSALGYLHRMFAFHLVMPTPLILMSLPLAILFMIWEWFQKDKEFQFDIGGMAKPVRVALYYFIPLCILLTGKFIDPTFIYFKF
jgi:alginate O-acetyltransferase complex protein AlgI